MKAAIFDLDGTLVDSAPDLHACINVLLSEKGFTSLDLDQVRSFIGHGIGNLVQRCLEAAGSPRTGESLARCIMRFVEIYAAAPAAHGTVYPGVMETLSSLKNDGWTLGICTNKADQLTDLVLEGFSLAPFFSASVSGNTSAMKKPSPEPLFECARRLDCPLENVIYVGDSETDAETAWRASVPFVLFTEGYRNVPVEDISHSVKFANWSEASPLIVSLYGSTQD